MEKSNSTSSILCHSTSPIICPICERRKFIYRKFEAAALNNEEDYCVCEDCYNNIPVEIQEKLNNSIELNPYDKGMLNTLRYKTLHEQCKESDYENLSILIRDYLDTCDSPCIKLNSDKVYIKPSEFLNQLNVKYNFNSTYFKIFHKEIVNHSLNAYTGIIETLNNEIYKFNLIVPTDELIGFVYTKTLPQIY